MGTLWFFSIFIVVGALHVMILKSQITPEKEIYTTQKRVQKITLSSVSVKKRIPSPPSNNPKPKPRVKQKQKSLKAEPKITKREIVQAVAPAYKIDTTSVRNKYASYVREKIERNLFYPKKAKRLRLQGVVIVKFTVNKRGSISHIRVINSPAKLLAKSAIKTLKKLRLKPIPTELLDRVLYFTIPLEFKFHAF